MVWSMRHGVKLSFQRLCFDNTVNLYRLSLSALLCIYCLFTLYFHCIVATQRSVKWRLFFFWGGGKRDKWRFELCSRQCVWLILPCSQLARDHRCLELSAASGAFDSVVREFKFCTWWTMYMVLLHNVTYIMTYLLPYTFMFILTANL